MLLCIIRMFKYLCVLCCGWYSRAVCIGRCSIFLHKPQSFCCNRTVFFKLALAIPLIFVFDLSSCYYWLIVLLCDDSFRSFFFNLHHRICWMMFGRTHWFDTFSELTTLLSFSFSTKFHRVFAWSTLATVFATTR